MDHFKLCILKKQFEAWILFIGKFKLSYNNKQTDNLVFENFNINIKLLDNPKCEHKHWYSVSYYRISKSLKDLKKDRKHRTTKQRNERPYTIITT